MSGCSRKNRGHTQSVALDRHGGEYMCAVTASELLVGVERANSAQRCARCGAFVENLLATIPVLEFTLPLARTHARMIAALSKNVTAGAHDAINAATAVHHGYGLLTRNVADFKIFQGLKIETFREVA